MRARPCSRRARGGPPVAVRAVVSAVVGAGILLGGCSGAGVGPGPSVPPSPSPSVSVSSPASAAPSAGSPVPPAPSSPTGGPPSASVPATGVTLRELGFVYGPVDAFSIPRGALFVTAVDQPNVVTLVLSAPSPTDVAGYLRTTLPANGFRLTADDPAARTLTFTGRGWDGTFTASAGSSAIVLDAA